MSRDVYEEGAVIFPCVKVQQHYSDIDDIIRICRLRIRVPDQWWGDYLALLGSARVAERNLQVFAAEVGWDRIDAFVEAWFDCAEQRMVEEIRKLPNRRVVVTTRHDPFDRAPDGIPVKVDISVEDDMIDIDLRDNLDCQPCGLNLTEATARTAAMLGVFNSLNGDVQPNTVFFAPATHSPTRDFASWAFPRHPASCSVATCNLTDRVANTIQRGMAELEDGVGLAEVGLSFPASVSVISGRDPRRGGAAYVDEIVLGWTGGPGGSIADGWLTMGGVGDAGILMRDSVELDELRFPIRIVSQRLVQDSEGAGRRRGAPAAIVEFGPVDAEIEAIYLSDGTVNPPQGARGGQAGSLASSTFVTSTEP